MALLEAVFRFVEARLVSGDSAQDTAIALRARSAFVFLSLVGVSCLGPFAAAFVLLIFLRPPLHPLGYSTPTPDPSITASVSPACAATADDAAVRLYLIVVGAFLAIFAGFCLVCLCAVFIRRTFSPGSLLS